MSIKRTNHKGESHPNAVHFDEAWQADVVYNIYIEEEDLEVRGNVLESGNPEEDKKAEDQVFNELMHGNIWAWCWVKVTATHPSMPTLKGSDSLGRCSYDSEADFKASSGYYPDMCDEALDDLTKQIRQIREITNI